MSLKEIIETLKSKEGMEWIVKIPFKFLLLYPLSKFLNAKIDIWKEERSAKIDILKQKQILRNTLNALKEHPNIKKLQTDKEGNILIEK